MNVYPQFYIEKNREDGAKLEIRIMLIGKNFIVKDIGMKTKNQRKFRYLMDEIKSEYEYRKLSSEGRREYEYDKFLEICPVELISEALEEAWLSIKP